MWLQHCANVTGNSLGINDLAVIETAKVSLGVV